MRSLLIIFLCFPIFAAAQVDMSQKEQIEQQRESNRKQDALSDEARKANPKASQTPQFHIEDTGTQLDVDHSAFSYSVISESDNTAEGIKFSGAFMAAIYTEKKKDKNYRLLAGAELPMDIDLDIRNLVPFWGAGFQFGSGFSLYGNLGLDLRLTNWFKIQLGANFDSQHGSGALLGAGLTW
jgi:hypothetical protein